MKPIPFYEQNSTLQKPANMTDEQCMPLPAFRGYTTLAGYDGQVPVTISKWELSPEEMKEIKLTGVVWLFQYSHIVAPSLIITEFPFIEPMAENIADDSPDQTPSE